ncbi:MAG: N-methyl-L-tryptophan oxidase, partial [Armatimonadetes bacterium]|nr:N-methyl-L-tryptophan oxidase [Armatimonadota bacterium]
IIRRVYPDRFYTRLMDAAYPLWEELQREAGEDLLIRTGGLFFGPEDHPEMIAVRDALDANHVSYDVMDAEAARRRFPAFRLYPGEIGIYQKDGGFLNASACVRTNLSVAASHGAEIRTSTPVERIEPGPESIAVPTADGSTLHADRVIVAAGPWMRELLSPFVTLPLVVTRQAYCHFEPRTPAPFEVGRFPIWIDFGTNVYGFPHERTTPGVKVAGHSHGAAVDPHAVHREVEESDREPLRAYCRERLPDLSPAIIYEKVCLYTNTPDEDFIIDHLPGEDRVTIMSCCSGHGFKFTALMGRIAAWRATGEAVPWDMSRFRLSRFL